MTTRDAIASKKYGKKLDTKNEETKQGPEAEGGANEAPGQINEENEATDGNGGKLPEMSNKADVKPEASATEEGNNSQTSCPCSVVKHVERSLFNTLLVQEINLLSSGRLPASTHCSD